MKRVLFVMAFIFLIIGCGKNNPVSTGSQNKNVFVPISNTWTFNPPDSATILLHPDYVPEGMPPQEDSLAITVTYRDAQSDSLITPCLFHVPVEIHSVHIVTVKTWEFN